MIITRVIWLPDVEDKLARKHSVFIEEAEEVLFGSPRVRFVEKGYRQGEDVYAAHGQTETGRYLIIFFILKRGREALVLSARDMDHKERRLYGRGKR